MAEIALRQIRAIIAVCEEGSFTRAAARENATQSGISQHVAAAERTLGVKLFERSAGRREADAGGAALLQALHRGGRPDSPTPAKRCAALPRASAAICASGLIPTLTRAALAPALEQFVAQYPDVRLHIVEGYSGSLTDMVRNDELDFAVVPASEGSVGLKSRLIVRDREMLVSNVKRGLQAVRAGAAEGLRAAEDHSAQAAPTCAAATSRSISRPTASRSPT